MMKSRREQELELENKKLKEEIELLKKTLKLKDKKEKQQNELLEDLLKESKIKQYQEAIRKNSLLKDEIKKLKNQLNEKDETIQNLATQIRKDSTNSSNPSSTDNIYKKKVHIVSSRKAGGKNGSQWNHKGTTFTKKEVEELIKDRKNNNIIYKVKYVGNKKVENIKVNIH